MASNDHRTYDDILSIIRTRICLAPSDAPYKLHENALAKEFGLSRTPIRQVLQELALAGLVETRAGVGTIATELPPQRRCQAFIVYRELARAAAICYEGAPIDDDVKIELIGQASLIQTMTEHNPQTYVRFSGHVAENMAVIVEDEILSNAIKTAHWRVIRWRAREYVADPAAAWSMLQNGLSRVAEALKSNDAAQVLRTVAGVSDELSRSPTPIAGQSRAVI